MTTPPCSRIRAVRGSPATGRPICHTASARLAASRSGDGSAAPGPGECDARPVRPAGRRGRPRPVRLAGRAASGGWPSSSRPRPCAPGTSRRGPRATAIPSSSSPASSPAPSPPSSSELICDGSATAPTTGGTAATSAPARASPSSLEELLLEIHDSYGRQVSLVGWSAGGIYAREMARALPDYTRSVITLGSPFRGHPASTRAWRMYRLMNRRNLARMFTEEALAQRAAPLQVPTTCIYSRTDGIVAWECCLSEPAPRNREHRGPRHPPGLRPRVPDPAHHRGPARPAGGFVAAVCRPSLSGRAARRRRGSPPSATRGGPAADTGAGTRQGGLTGVAHSRWASPLDAIFLMGETAETLMHVASLLHLTYPAGEETDYLRGWSRTCGPPASRHRGTCACRPACSCGSPCTDGWRTTTSTSTTTCGTRPSRAPAVSGSSASSSRGCTPTRSTSAGHPGRCTSSKACREAGSRSTPRSTIPWSTATPGCASSSGASPPTRATVSTPSSSP